MDHHKFYDTLGVDRNASAEDIKKAYRTLALKFHPDRNSDIDDAEERFKEISEAYSVLSDSEKRRHYDMHGDSSGPGNRQRYSSTEDIFDHFGDIFGDIFGGRQRRRGPRRGAAVLVDVSLSFLESALGCKQVVT